MSKDKGHKNVKKAPADKTEAKPKVLSAYKREDLNAPLIIPIKTDDKAAKKKK